VTGTRDRRLLLVEDETYLADLVCRFLRSAGYEVTHAARLSEAVALLTGADCFDAAVLDVNLAGVEVFPLARDLRNLGIPLLFASGYGKEGLPGDLAHYPMLQKPYQPDPLLEAVSAMLS